MQSFPDALKTGMKDKQINENKPWLQTRIRNCEKYEGCEQVYRHYIKSKRGYFLNAFFGKNFWKYMLFTGLAAIMFLTARFGFHRDDMKEFFYAMYFFMGLGVFMWLVDLTIKLWFWKYTKHVIVSDKGVWIMIFSTFWWSKAYDGKKHFFSPSWSFYSWSELAGVFSEVSRVSKICKLSDFVMCRWDGEQAVRYLEPDEVDEIEGYAKKHIPKSKWVKKRAPKRKFSIFDFMT